jgi:hypothetical protein
MKILIYFYIQMYIEIKTEKFTVLKLYWGGNQNL